jgi:undecaprenyl-diphosphatase
MSLFDALLLGLLQGLTEFLPISSSGHLILLRELLGLQSEFGLAIDATLHFATAFAVLLYFRKDIYELVIAFTHTVQRKFVETETKILMYAIIVGTVPAVFLGLTLESSIETLFRSAELVAWVLIAGSVLFMIAEYVTKRFEAPKALTIKKGLYIGFFQALALIPGLSRSGATISGGMLLGLTRERSARFAFLLSFPIIIGAGSKKLIDLGGAGLVESEWLAIGFGALIAFLSGLLCIHYLLKFLKNHTLYVFVIYRIALASTILLFM